MTPFEIQRLDFTPAAVASWAPLNHCNTNWPIVYVLDNAAEVRPSTSGAALNDVYVGESRNAAARMRQHGRHCDPV
jgi:hypothetical protein